MNDTSRQNPTFRADQSWKHLGKFDRYTVKKPIDEGDTRTNSIIKVYHVSAASGENQTEEEFLQSMRQVTTNDDTLHITFASPVGGKGSSIPRFSEITLTIPDLHINKEDASRTLTNKLISEGKSPLNGIRFSDHSQIPQTHTTDECDGIAYSRVLRERDSETELQKDLNYQSTFDVYSGRVRLTGPHRGVMALASASTDLLIPYIKSSRLQEVYGQVESFPIGRSTSGAARDSPYILSMQKSSCPFTITVTDTDGTHYDEERMIATSSLDRHDTRLLASEDTKGLCSWSAVALSDDGNTLTQHYRI
ncbi:uncharacterized protein IL334_006490 [Kwoniella shivajii]|uniref:Uncharacterized protein n=1 Tax=Kwoniella shivajii TaxID=564305 RepID=A0ABZ1D644_9TREE|nr:hypothetical protein IL334_006490 [Kwoniella shivajii]